MNPNDYNLNSSSSILDFSLNVELEQVEQQMKQVFVTKRDGRIEEQDLNKIHKVCEYACEGIEGVSVSELEMELAKHLHDNITTTGINEALVSICKSLMIEGRFCYDKVGGRLISYIVRKEAYGQFEAPHILDLVVRNVAIGRYDPDIPGMYTNDEWNEINSIIDHSRDSLFRLAGADQMRVKYLSKNRVTRQIYESFQIPFILVPAVLFRNETNKMKLIKQAYDNLSLFDISQPSPIMSGVRTILKQFSSCVLVDVADNLESIASSGHAIQRYVAAKAGFGVNVGRNRGLGAPVKNGEIVHTGLLPFIKKFTADVKSLSQGGMRDGAVTFYFQMWHYEFPELVMLKDSTLPAEQTNRQADYCVQINKFLYKRIQTNGVITLFSPAEVPGLYEAFFSDQEEFARLYELYEKDTSIRKRVFSAQKLFNDLVTQRSNTGRIYISNVDHMNDKSAFKVPVYQSNLCVVGETLIKISEDQGVTSEVIRIDDFCTKFNNNYYNEVYVTSFDTLKVAISGNFGDIPACGWAKVTKAFQSKLTDELVTVKSIYTSNSVTCTPDHKIFTINRGWIPAAEISGEHRLLCEVYYVPYPNKICDILSESKEAGSTEFRKLVTPVPVYDLTVEGTHTFFANGIGISNCTEIALPTKPLHTINDGLEQGSEISICTLGAINWGKINKPSDFAQPCRMAVRIADAVLDYQNYPVEAARASTMARRPIGIGIIGLAHFLAKRGMPYGRISLPLIDEYAEAWSYYLIKASLELAIEKGPCPLWKETKYADGWTPNLTRTPGLDRILPHVERMDWAWLRGQIQEHGIRNSTLMAVMPSETSSQISNSTNGVEPAMGLVVVKASKDAAPPIAVPDAEELKNDYDWLWEQKSPRGYLEVTAVIQKYDDQAISVNTTYNPKFFKDGKLDTTTLGQDIMYAYSLGHKNIYYQNTKKPGEAEILNFTEDNSELGCESGACSI